MPSMIIHVLAKVASLFLMLVVGVLARFRRVITDEALDNLCKIVLSVTLPFLFIYVLSTRCTRDALSTLWMAPLFAASIIFIGFAIGEVVGRLLKLPPKRKDAFTFLTSFQNSGFLAIPIALVLFGQEGVLTVVMFTLGFNFLYWTFGIWIFSRSSVPFSLKSFKNLINPAMAALILGILFGVFCVRLPRFFLDTSRILGDATVPLAMLVVGAILGTVKFRRGAEVKEMATLVFCRLILIPVIYLVLIGQFKGLPPLMRSILMLQACMPSASTSPLLARRYGGDYNLAASGVFFTTLFSIITIPIFMSLV